MSKKKVLVFTLFAVPLLFVLLAGLGNIYHNPAYQQIYALSQPAAEQTLLLEETEFGTLYCFNNHQEGVVLLLDEEGQVLYERNYPFPFYQANLQGNSMFAAAEDSSGAVIHQLDIQTLTEVNQVHLGMSLQDILLFDFDAAGNSYLLTYFDTCTLMMMDSSGMFLGEIAYEKPISFLQIKDETLYVYSGENQTLTISTLNNSQLQREIQMPAKPFHILNFHWLITLDGEILDYSKDILSSPFTFPDQLHPFSFDVSEETQKIIWIENPQRAVHYDIKNDITSVYEIDSYSFYALAHHAAITGKDGLVYHTKLDSFEEKPIPTPSPTPLPIQTPAATQKPTPTPAKTPKPTPEPTTKPNIDELVLPEWAKKRENILFIPQGKTVKTIKDAFSPFTVTLYNHDNLPITAGTIRTGYAVTIENEKPYYFVVPGDCNASGTVNRADIIRVQNHLLGTEPLEDIYFIAADLDNNQIINTTDLILLSKLIKEKK